MPSSLGRRETVALLADYMWRVQDLTTEVERLRHTVASYAAEAGTRAILVETDREPTGS